MGKHDISDKEKIFRDSVVGRFFAKVDVNDMDECWQWTAAKNRLGYGAFSVPLSFTKIKHFRAHRYIWELLYGSIPDGMLICHHCDNPSCVNPVHLFIGTPYENTQDMYRKGRNRKPNATKTHCKRGHLLAGDNLYVRPGPHRPRRECKACIKLVADERYAEVKRRNLGQN